MKKIGPAAPRQRAAVVLTHEEGQAITFCEGSVQALRLRCDLRVREAPGVAADARSTASWLLHGFGLQTRARGF